MPIEERVDNKRGKIREGMYMKKFWATVLAGCLAVQSLSGYALAAEGAEPGIIVLEDSGSAGTDGGAGMENAGGAEIPQLEVDVTPQPEAGEIPQPEVSGTPQPEVNEIPQPEVSVVPQPEVSETPQPEAGGTPQPEVSGTPQPETQDTSSADNTDVPVSGDESAPQDGTDGAPAGNPEDSLTGDGNTAQTPDTTQTSDTVQTPDTTQTSDTVQTPDTTQTSDTVQTPGTTQTPDTAQGSDTAPAPDVPQTPDAQGPQPEMPTLDWAGENGISLDDLTVDGDWTFEDIEVIDDAGLSGPGSDTGAALEPESESESETESEPDMEMMAETELVTEEGAADEYRLLSAGEWNGSCIEVKVVSTLPFLDMKKIDITLSGSSLIMTEPRSVYLPNAGRVSATETFSVAPGEYTVTVHADQFADFTETVSVGTQQTARLEICTSRVQSLSADAQHPEEVKATSGWLRLGDVDGDTQITENDINKLLDAVHSESMDPSCDLDEDGIVDLSDLQLAVQSLNDGQAATVSLLSVPREVKQDANTMIEGAENLLSNSGSATLKPVGAGEISAENPVSMTFDFQTQGESEELPALEGMTIQAPVTRDESTGAVTSDIASGYALVEYLDDAETKYYKIPLEKENPQEVMESASLKELPQSLMLLTTGAPLEILPVESIEEIDEAEVSEAAQAAEEEAAGNGIVEEFYTDEFYMDEFYADAASPTAAPPVSDPAANLQMPEDQAETLPPAALEPDGSFVLNFGGQIAVKRVTIRITGTTKKEEALAEIARVQFVNDMESRIPAPDLSIPTISEVQSKNEELAVSWKEQTNVTGYEVEVSGPVKKATGTYTQVVRVGGSPHTIVSINDKSLINYNNYTIRVRSVNGEWSSPWSQPVTAQPKPEKGPGRVDNVVAKGGYRSLHVTWKDMDDSNGYMLYYREKDGGDFLPAIQNYTLPKDGAGRLMTNQYTITGLKDAATYEVYVIGWNDFEQGSWGQERSRLSEAMTESGETPKLPKYHLLNTYNGTYDDKAEENVGRVTDHIVSAVCGTHNGQKMVESPLDQAEDAKGYPTVNGAQRKYARWAYGAVDNSYSSYWIKHDWDDGVAYPISDFSKGITVTFDAKYKMNYLTFTAADMQGNPETAKIVYWEDPENGKGEEVGCSVIRNLDDTKRPYYVVKFDKTVEAKQIQLYIGTGYYKIDLKIAEIHFHRYNEQVDDVVEALFADAEHSMLSEKLTSVDKEAALAMISQAEAVVNTPDEITGEYHPLKAFLLLDIEAARELLELRLDEPVRVDPGITAKKDGHINFGGLNEWQPLGRVAASGDALTVYVGHNFKKIRENTNLQLIFTQYHAESSTLAKSISLKVGANKITLPEITTDPGQERGGQLYVAYTGNNPNDQYVVRINGGVKIPVLNVHNMSAEARRSAISEYISELETYAAGIEQLHGQKHAGSGNRYVDMGYDVQNCILNATDLMMDYMMYSVPASQIQAALNKYSSSEQKIMAMENALDAIENTMKLFYQHKGLFKGAGGNKETPSRHLNIRYMQMFTGAFMYASGNHIGVEYPETKLAMSASWDGFGWGVAHEIGHDINDPAYAIAEITNNYFAQLLTKAANEGHSTRFKYEDVYRKVTSGTVGRSPNGAVQLALYWQLHLAFDDYTAAYGDDGYRDDRYIFDDYQTMFDNLFFARVDTYSRNPGAAPKNPDKSKAVELKLTKDVDQNLMRLSCAAAKEDILPFFERWGMVPDEDTRKFAGQYGEPTEKALYYVNDDVRNYRVDHSGQEDTLNVRNAEVSIQMNPAEGNRVKLNLSTSGVQTDAILGYEVSRSMYVNGRRQPAVVVGFELAGEDGNAVYTDTISALDNRVLYYEVRAVDKFLNYSPVTRASGTRISTGGALGKHSWTVETTLASDDDTNVTYGHDDPDAGYGDDITGPGRVYSIVRIIDDKPGTQYNGTIQGTEGQIVIDMQKPMEVTSLRYQGGELKDVTIRVSLNGSTWVTVKENYHIPESAEELSTIWFDAVQPDEKEKWIGTYDARYVMLVLSGGGEDGGTVSINEIDICGPSGDDIAFFSAEGSEGGLPAAGIVAEDYVYAKENTESGSADLKIPKGSLLFAGTYKGNPAYNVVVLYDEEGNVIGADKQANAVDSEQVIFADVPKQGNLGETSKGIWVYFVTPKEDDEGYIQRVYDSISGKRVRAELYRVDKAHTLEGERVVSDTAFTTLPESFGELKSITLSDDNLKKTQETEG